MIHVTEYEWDGVHLVWMDPATGAQVYLGREKDFTRAVINDNKIEMLISVNSNGVDAERHAMFKERTQHFHFPFHDAPSHEQTRDTKIAARTAVLALKNAIKDGQRVGIHCHAGIHRSPAVVYVALTSLGYFQNTYEAYKHVSRIRPYARYYKTLVKWVETVYGEK